MRIGFLAAGSAEGAASGEMRAYYLRIFNLQNFVESQGIETSLAFTDTFKGKISIAPFSNKRELRKFLDSCDAVYLGATDCAAMAACAKKSGKGLIFDSHTPLIGERLMYFKAEKTPRNLFLYLRSLYHEWLAAKTCKVITTVSDSAIEYYQKTFGRKPEELFLVRNAIDLQMFPFSEMPIGNMKRFAYTGGMEAWQGIPDLIDAYAQVRDRVHLTLVGFLPHTQELKKKAIDYGIDAYDSMPREDAMQHLAKSHFGVTATPAICGKYMPGAFPTKFAEYLAMNRAVMVTRNYDCAAIAESNQFGIVCESGVKGIAEGFRRAADLDLETIKSMAERGRQWVLNNCLLDKAGNSMIEAAKKAAEQSP